MAFNGKLMAKKVSTDVGPFPLTKAQIQFYWDNGFLIIRKLYDVPTLDLFRDRFVEICNKRTKSSLLSVVKDPELFKAGSNPETYINKIQELLFEPVFMKYSEDPRMLHIVSQLIGNDVTAYNSMLINKPPGTRDHPPHQDLLYFPFRPADKIVGAWTAVDPATIQNGCLFVIPTSHKAETLYNHGDKATDKKQFFYGIQDEMSLAPMDRRLNLTMEPGDTVFFHPYLIHGSGANHTKECRKAMAAHYANSSGHYIDVKGTIQEHVADKIMEEMSRRGLDLDYAGLWRVKSKQVKGVRSQL